MSSPLPVKRSVIIPPALIACVVVYGSLFSSLSGVARFSIQTNVFDVQRLIPRCGLLFSGIWKIAVVEIHFHVRLL
jgi:hypothetical protein